MPGRQHENKRGSVKKKKKREIKKYGMKNDHYQVGNNQCFSNLCIHHTKPVKGRWGGG